MKYEVLSLLRTANLIGYKLGIKHGMGICKNTSGAVGEDEFMEIRDMGEQVDYLLSKLSVDKTSLEIFANAEKQKGIVEGEYLTTT